MMGVLPPLYLKNTGMPGCSQTLDRPVPAAGESFQDRKKLSPRRSFEPMTICR
jgi:hypothetical protein